MKVTNWRRNLMASLVAAGTLSPAACGAANLNTNLVVNGDFEAVDPGTTGDYGAPSILNWSGGPGFAYSHNESITGIPDYADGADPPSPGLWYFTSNNNPGSATGDWRAPDLVFQDIDVSTGDTGAQIAVGEAAFKLSAYMSSFSNDNDSGNVQVDFKNAGGTTIGTASIRDLDIGPNNVWSLNSNAGLVPAGTASVRVSIFGTPLNAGADGYIDNVDFQLAAAPDELLFLSVDSVTGGIGIRNETGEPIAFDYYEISSASSSLRLTNWASLQDQNLAGFPAGNGTGNGWEEFGGSDSGVIGESYLTGSSSLANDSEIPIGTAFDPAGAHDLVFRYGKLTTSVQVPGDYNTNGTVDAADYVLWRENVNQNVTLPNDSTPGTVDEEDYDVWRANFGRAGGPGGPSTLTTGFVRYGMPDVGIGSAAAVPEHASVIYAGVGLGALALGARRKLSKE